MKKNKKVKIALVNWTDSALHGTDTYRSDDKILKPIKAVSCGIIVINNKEQLTLAIDWWETGDYRNLETIYKRQINHIQYFDLELKNKEVEHGE